MGLYSTGCIYKGAGALFGMLIGLHIWVGGVYSGGGVGLINRILRYLSGILKL